MTKYNFSDSDKSELIIAPSIKTNRVDYYCIRELNRFVRSCLLCLGFIFICIPNKIKN